MNLEVLDKSKENYKKSWRSYEEPFEDEPRRKKEQRLAVNSVETVGEDKTEGAVTQLQKALASCMKEMAEMRKAFGTSRVRLRNPMLRCREGTDHPSTRQEKRRQPTATSDHVYRIRKVPVDIEEWDLVNRPT